MGNNVACKVIVKGTMQIKMHDGMIRGLSSLWAPLKLWGANAQLKVEL